MEAPAAPSSAPGGASAAEGTLVLGYDPRIAASLPVSPPQAHPASPSAQLCLASCIIRFVATPSDLSPRLGGRDRRLSETGRLTERGNRAGAAVRAPRSHKYPPSSEWEMGGQLAPGAGFDLSVPPRGEHGGTRRRLELCCS